MVNFNVFFLHLVFRPRQSVKCAVPRQVGIQEIVTRMKSSVTRMKSSAETERRVIVFVCPVVPQCCTEVVLLPASKTCIKATGSKNSFCSFV